MLSPSVLNRTVVPRSCRICFLVRLIMPWRLRDCVYSTFPEPVILKRFLAHDLVLILGIWLSFRRHAGAVGHLLDVSVLIEHFAAATAAHCAGRRKAGFMAEARPNDNPAQALTASAEMPARRRSTPGRLKTG